MAQLTWHKEWLSPPLVHQCDETCPHNGSIFQAWCAERSDGVIFWMGYQLDSNGTNAKATALKKEYLGRFVPPEVHKVQKTFELSKAEIVEKIEMGIPLCSHLPALMFYEPETEGAVPFPPGGLAMKPSPELLRAVHQALNAGLSREQILQIARSKGNAL